MLWTLQQGQRVELPEAQGSQMALKGLIEAESDGLKVIFLHLRFSS